MLIHLIVNYLRFFAFILVQYLSKIFFVEWRYLILLREIIIEARVQCVGYVTQCHAKLLNVLHS